MNPVKAAIALVIVVLVAFGIYHASKGGSAEVTGTVSYLEKIALPSGSRVEVKLLDVSEQDLDRQVVAEQVITTSGENVPLPFTLSYDAGDIDQSKTYSVAARIFIGGDLAWVSTQSYPVITNGYPMTADVYVSDVR